GFARSRGVTAAVLRVAAERCLYAPRAPQALDGLDRKALAQLKLYAAGKLPGDFLEVMACAGGCVNGPSSLRK
ncbi:MAG: hydrogenase, partial [Planctomycetes bacterium]|nr:hydrogenase [Planctomycetota bacterium]